MGMCAVSLECIVFAFRVMLIHIYICIYIINSNFVREKKRKKIEFVAVNSRHSLRNDPPCGERERETERKKERKKEKEPGRVEHNTAYIRHIKKKTRQSGNKARSTDYSNSYLLYGPTIPCHGACKKSTIVHLRR